MKMDEHQHRLWKKMIDLIESYLSNETQDFYGIVGKLEGALDAIDNNLQNGVRKRFIEKISHAYSLHDLENPS